MQRMNIAGWLVLMILWGGSNCLAQNNQTCFDCHDDPTFTMERGGREISLNVNPADYRSAAHAGLGCIECHKGYDPEEEPHTPQPTAVNCSSCHSGESRHVLRSGHSGKIGCVDCHADMHRAAPLQEARAGCRNCHEEAETVFRGSVHSAELRQEGCTACHLPHLTLPETTQQCVDCHSRRAASEKDQQHGGTFVQEFEKSVHAGMVECSDCHGGHAVLAADSSGSPLNRAHLEQTCGTCHEEVAEEFGRSEHGQQTPGKTAVTPGCVDCHGEHQIYSITDRRSPVNRRHQIDICLSCHLDKPEVQQQMTHAAGFVAGYAGSIHGRASAAGDTLAAVCSDCHGSHSALKASNPQSPVNKFALEKTCGNCHQEIAGEYSQSIHGQALHQGVSDAPTCTDCHGEHDILEPADRASPVAPGNVSREVCGPCHQSVKLAEKYGISSDRFSAYNDSYHGLAVRAGAVEAANCASCHLVHDILPASDRRSSINPERLAETCGKCHPGANSNFARGKVHVSGSRSGENLLYWISTIYLTVIIVLIGAMSAHNGLDWFRKLRVHYRRQIGTLAGEEAPRKPGRLFQRMTVGERIQHLLLLISFFLLVITGFMLKFPDAWWASAIRRLGGEGVFALRGLLHRIAAVVMIGDALFHLGYVLFTTRGRSFLRDILPRSRDGRDLLANLGYYLGLRGNRPQFDRFNYIEKSEYWALVWGTAVMALTGIALWFENQFMGWFSKLFVDVNEVIHYYEAWLAFLAILVWHLYYVIFNPDVYPMNFTWITGKVTEEEMRRDHPLELEKIEEEEEARRKAAEAEIEEDKTAGKSIR